MTSDKKTKTPVETPVIEVEENLASPDVFPDFAVTLDEANRRVRLFQEFVRDHMVEGEDYGTIPGVANKPTLFKAGAEKLNAIFGLAPLVEITNRVEDWDTNFVAYEVKVTLLNKRTNNIEAEGIGSCNSRERRYKTQEAANIANTVLKIAKKRGLIDATLSATRASGMFTQDLEDMETERDSHQRPAPRQEVPAPKLGTARNGSFSRGEASLTNLTEAQRGAILSMANKAFGRALHEELARMVDKPIAQLSKSEASTLIDRLRSLLPEQSGGRQMAGSASR